MLGSSSQALGVFNSPVFGPAIANVNGKKHTARADGEKLYKAANGDYQDAELLLKHGANVNYSRPKSYTHFRGATPLIMGTASGKQETVRLLLDYKANVNQTDAEGETALMWAARYGRRECVQLLLGSKADLRITNEQGKTASDIAFDAKRQEIHQLLARFDAKPHKTHQLPTISEISELPVVSNSNNRM